MKNKQTPEIRFAGFTEDWEQRKLEEVASYRNGKAHEKDISENGKFIVINSKFVSTNGKTRKYSDKQIEPMKVNEIAFVLSDVPNGRAIARTFLVDENNKYSLNQRIAGITPNSNTDAYFLNVLLNRHQYFLRFDDGVGQTNLSKKDVENFSEKYPSMEEQSKIGKLFKQLDDTITLHQQELTILKQTKQGFLQKMFPKEGESVPEVRFPGFTGDWEERKLEEILKVNSGRDYKHLQQGNIPVYGTGGYMLSVNDKLSDENAIGIGRKGTIDNPQLLKAPFWTVDTLFYMTTKEKNDLLFCYSLANKIYWKKYDESTGVPSLSKSSIDKISISIPTPAEQSKIGNFFKQLDDTISLHHRELEALKETKKAFLQKMFV